MGVEKHLRITGTSTVSWKDAIVQAVAEASKTIDYLSNVKTAPAPTGAATYPKICYYFGR